MFCVKEGEYIPHQISVKLGALDFAYTVPSSKASGHAFSVIEHQVNIEVALTSQDSGVAILLYIHVFENRNPLPNHHVLMQCHTVIDHASIGSIQLGRFLPRF